METESPLSEPAVAIAAAAIDPDRDDDTRAGGFDPATLGTPPGIPGQPPAPPVTARPVARLLLPEGETVDVDRVVLVGRAPEARRAEGTESPHLVAGREPAPRDLLDPPRGAAGLRRRPRHPRS